MGCITKHLELDLNFISDRGDMTKPDNFYDCHPMKRTLEEMQEMAKMRPGENYCCVHQPLLNLPVDHIILDELHLMLRITDILINNLISDAMQWDEKDDIRKTRNVPKGEHLKRLLDTIRSCGVSFSVWEKINADGKGSGTWDWTSLMGDDRKKLMHELPPKLDIAIQPDTAQTVIQLWKVTSYINQLLLVQCNSKMYSFLIIPFLHIVQMYKCTNVQKHQAV